MSPQIYSRFISTRLIEKGGDWDRRNRLKVYRGLHLLSIRQFKRGGELLLDALSTFTATELLSYNDFVALTVISNTLTLSRPDLKKKARFHLADYTYTHSRPGSVHSLSPRQKWCKFSLKSPFSPILRKTFTNPTTTNSSSRSLNSNKLSSCPRVFSHNTHDTTYARCVSSHTPSSWRVIGV